MREREREKEETLGFGPKLNENDFVSERQGNTGNEEGDSQSRDTRTEYGYITNKPYWYIRLLRDIVIVLLEGY